MLPGSQVPANGPYPESDISSSHQMSIRPILILSPTDT